MFIFRKPRWTPLPADEFSDINSTKSTSTSCSFRRQNYAFWAPWILAAVSTLCCFWLSTSIIFRERCMTRKQCIDFTSSWSPALEILQDEEAYTLRTFNGSVFFWSPYKGPPSDSVDSTWHQITHVADAVSLTEEDILRLGKDPKVAVRLPKEFGGQFMGTLEGGTVFHQLHCLNLLWKGTHMEYYRELGEALGTDREKELRTHLDHCADILRQNLQCTADLGFLTYAWIEGRDIPWPDFSTQHKCRNFEKVVDWGHAHAIPLYKNGPFTQTAGAPTFPTPF